MGLAREESSSDTLLVAVIDLTHITSLFFERALDVIRVNLESRLFGIRTASVAYRDTTIGRIVWSVMVLNPPKKLSRNPSSARRCEDAATQSRCSSILDCVLGSILILDQHRHLGAYLSTTISCNVLRP